MYRWQLGENEDVSLSSTLNDKGIPLSTNFISGESRDFYSRMVFVLDLIGIMDKIQHRQHSTLDIHVTKKHVMVLFWIDSKRRRESFTNWHSTRRWRQEKKKVPQNKMEPTSWNYIISFSILNWEYIFFFLSSIWSWQSSSNKVFFTQCVLILVETWLHEFFFHPYSCRQNRNWDVLDWKML